MNKRIVSWLVCNIFSAFCYVSIFLSKDYQILDDSCYFGNMNDFFQSSYFFLQTRNVDSKKNLGEFPAFVSAILERISMLPKREDVETTGLDQLTVSNCVFLPFIQNDSVNQQCKSCSFLFFVFVCICVMR